LVGIGLGAALLRRERYAANSGREYL